MAVNLKRLIAKLNSSTRAALEAAAGACASRTHYEVDIEHFFLKLLDAPDNDLIAIGRHFGLDLSRLAADLDRSLDRFKAGAKTPLLSPHLVEALVRGWLYGSLEFDANAIRSGHVLVALLAEDELRRIALDVSREFDRIDAGLLRRDFALITQQSAEGREAPAGNAAAEEARVSGGPRVFLSYRREEGEFHADVLFDRMLAMVPHVQVFRDTDTLQPGMVFSEMIDETIGACDIVIALIGDKWLTAQDQDGGRRLDNPEDWVRREIAAALRLKKTLVPCLIGGARMPARTELPPDLAGMELRHAVTLSQAVPRRETEELIRMLKTWKRPTRTA